MSGVDLSVLLLASFSQWNLDNTITSLIAKAETGETANLGLNALLIYDPKMVFVSLSPLGNRHKEMQGVGCHESSVSEGSECALNLD